MRLARTSAIGAVAVMIAVTLTSPATAVDGVTEVCRFTDARLTEISGMTYSQRHPGVIYVHNDSSGGPLVYAVDATTCATLATLTVEGIEARDIEAIGSGRDRKGRPVLWVADIGDNVDSWPEVRVHRLREPKVLRDRTVRARTYRFTYPDRPHNAEALLADPASSRVWIVTKQAARGTLYALPERLSRTALNIAERVGRAGAMVTDASVSPDGRRFAVRDYVDAEVRAGLPPGSDPQTVYLPLQLQGEAMTWTQDGSALLVAGERDDRLLRVELPAGAVSSASASSASASASPGPSSAASSPSPSPNGEVTPGAGASDGQQLTSGQGAGDEGGQLPAVLLAGGLIGLAVLVIASAEWRRRRPPAAR